MYLLFMMKWLRKADKVCSGLGKGQKNRAEPGWSVQEQKHADQEMSLFEVLMKNQSAEISTSSN